MPLDPAAAALLAQIDAAGFPPISEQTPDEARLAFQGFEALAGPGEPLAEIDDRMIPGPAGDIPVRVYTPEQAEPGGPGLVYFHGGGWVIGSVDGTDTICRALANRSGCVIVSVGYRLAPEHKFPAPLDDCYGALEWIHQHGDEFGIDPDRLAVGGDSAGGNLAAATTLKARDENGPPLRFQLLVYPVTNHSFDTASYRENADGYLLTADTMRWFWAQYLGDDADGDNPLASPLRAGDVSGLPPALIATAEFDPLRDEGEAYAARLAAAGVAVTQMRYDGLIHVFWQLPGMFPAAIQLADAAATAMRAAFAAVGPQAATTNPS